MEMSKIVYEQMCDTILIDTGGLIRVGILDLTRGYGPEYLTRVLKNLETSEGLGTDTRDLFNTAMAWDEPTPLEMESGTLFRILWFYFTKNHIDRQIIPVKTLVKRVEEMKLDKDIVNWPLAKLGTLEGGTTQYQTAAILMGNKETLEEIPFYLRKTYSVLADWEKHNSEWKPWNVPKDPTLITQCDDYLSYLMTGEIKTKPDRLGDCDLYCFLRAFNVASRGWAEKNWPQLKQHESDRFQHTEDALKELDEGRVVYSKDHRVVEALAMLTQVRNIHERSSPLSIEQIKQRFSNPDCVAKKWPKFWEAMSYCKSTYKN